MEYCIELDVGLKSTHIRAMDRAAGGVARGRRHAAAAKVTGVLSSVGRSVPPKDVGDFKGRAHPTISPAASPPSTIGRAGSS